MKIRALFIALPLGLLASVVALHSADAGKLPPAPPPPPSLAGCHITPQAVTADNGTDIQDCRSADELHPKPASAYSPLGDIKKWGGSKAKAGDGSVAMFCHDWVNGGVTPVPASTKLCPGFIGPPPRIVAHRPVPGENPDGSLSCGPGRQTTKQIEAICETGDDPGESVNGTPGPPPDPTCARVKPGQECFDLKGNYVRVPAR